METGSAGHHTDSCLRIGLLNPWSVCNKPHQIHDLIIDEELDALALIETWLSGTPHQDNVILTDLLPPGYCIKNNARKNRRGGGTALIHRESMNIRSLPARNEYESFELLECRLASSALIRLYVVYRPPGQSTKRPTANFIDEFADFASHMITQPGLPIVLGDFNYHVDDEANRDGQHFLQLMDAFDLKQHITTRTHRNGHTLDLIITRALDGIVKRHEVKDCGFPDHYLVSADLNIKKPDRPMKTVTYRNLKKITPGALSNKINLGSLQSAMQSGLDVNQFALLYDEELSKALDAVAPEKTRSIPVRSEQEWFDDDIRKAKQKRRQAERKWRKTDLTVHRQIYMQAKTDVDNLVNEKKSKYFKNSIEQHKGNTKQLFKHVNSLLGRNMKQSLPFNESSQQIAEMFSDFFIEKIAVIKDSIPDTQNDFSELWLVNTELCTFNSLSTTEVRNLVKSCASKSCKLDPLPTDLTKQELDSLIPAIH